MVSSTVGSPGVRSTRRRATVTISAPDRWIASRPSSSVRYLPVPTSRRDSNVRPPMHQGIVLRRAGAAPHPAADEGDDLDPVAVGQRRRRPGRRGTTSWLRSTATRAGSMPSGRQQGGHGRARGRRPHSPLTVSRSSFMSGSESIPPRPDHALSFLLRDGRQGGRHPAVRQRAGDPAPARVHGCGRRFTTYERIDEILPLVVKKDGRREPFDRAKILSGLKKACSKRPVPVEVVEARSTRSSASSRRRATRRSRRRASATRS